MFRLLRHLQNPLGLEPNETPSLVRCLILFSLDLLMYLVEKTLAFFPFFFWTIYLYHHAFGNYRLISIICASLFQRLKLISRYVVFDKLLVLLVLMVFLMNDLVFVLRVFLINLHPLLWGLIH